MRLEPDDLPLDPAAQIGFIRQFMAEGRRAVAFDATPFVAWGALVVAGTAAEYAAVALGRHDVVVWLWAVVVAAGWLAAWVTHERHRRRTGATTFARRALGTVWVGCWSAMTVVGFVGALSGRVAPGGVAPALAAIMGAGFFATGTLTGEPLVGRLGAVWWGVATVLFLVPAPLVMAAFAVAMVLFQVVPAVVLGRRWRARGPLPVGAARGPRLHVSSGAP